MPPSFFANFNSTTPLANAPYDSPYDISINTGLLGILTSSSFYLCIPNVIPDIK